MARANNNGWSFVKVGGKYQYKEDWWIAMVTVLEDNSTAEQYVFKLRVDKSNDETMIDDFDIRHQKEPGGYWNGMLQLYEQEEYVCKYKWERGNKEE